MPGKRTQVETAQEDRAPDVPLDVVEKPCKKHQPRSTLTITVTQPGSAALIANVRIFVTNGDGSITYTPNNGQQIEADPGTYTLRACGNWHVPAPVTAAGVQVPLATDVRRALNIAPLRFHLHVDADRDGNVDADRTGLDNWRYGNHGGRKGAIILCNNDDDDANHTIDHADQVVNDNNDHTEVAPLEVRRAGANHDPSAQWTARLEILAGHHDRARVFDGRVHNANEVIGPTQGDHYDLPDLNFGSRTFGVEAISYAVGPAFDGLITIRLTVTANTLNDAMTAFTGPATTYHEDVQFRVAPWMIASHLIAAEELYATDLGGPNGSFLRTLQGVADALPIPLTTWNGNDVWMQDCMELGQHRSPHASFRVVNQGPRRRGLDPYPRTLLGRDLGYVRPAHPALPTTFDSTGNLEVTPPLVGHDRVRYPYGRIYYCPGDGVDGIDADFERFLNAQVVQAPLQVDTSFFAVGHVDELLSFVPAPPPHSSQGFKLLIASPRKAYEILQRADRNWPVLRGRKNYRGTVSFETTVRDFLLRDVPDPLGRAVTDVRLLRYNCGVINGFEAVQEAIDRVFAGLIEPLGLAIPENDPLWGHAQRAGCAAGVLDRARQAAVAAAGICDVIEVPVVFEPNRDDARKVDGLTVNMVNMVVVNDRCIVPMAFGPTNPVTDGDLFETYLETALTTLGLQVTWINTWYEYHLSHGGVHCGSNTKRALAPFDWWMYPNA